MNAINADLKSDTNTDSAIVKVYIFPDESAGYLASEDGLSPREINGIAGYGGYSQKVYTYIFEDNGNTVAIIAPSKDSSVLETVVKDY